MKPILLACLLLAARAGATTYTLAVSTLGPVSPSIVFSSNPVTGINCGSTNTACSADFASGSTVTLTEIDASTTAFAGWTGANGCQTNEPTCDVFVTANSSVTATFNPLVSISLSGVGLGTVTDATGQVNCASTNGCVGAGAQTYAYASGSTVTFTETAGSTSTFVGWTGDAGCNTASTCTITLNGFEAIVATFTSVGPFTINVQIPNGGGTVWSSPAGIDCGSTSTACAVAFSSGTTITLSTEAADGFYFSGWQNGGCASSTTACVVVSSSAYQGLGGSDSPAAYFYATPP